MEDLIGWLRVQIDWDEQDLRPIADWARNVPYDQTQGRLTHMGGTTALMTARRAVAEVAAKRQILDRCVADLAQRGDGALEGRVDCTPWAVLTALAQPYADRSGFHAEWRL